MTTKTQTADAGDAGVPPQPGAAPLKHERYELFAQEVASGKTKTDAYLEVYESSRRWQPQAVHVKSSALAARPEVKERIAYLQARAADASGYTLGSHLARLNALSMAAEKAGDFHAAVKAEENRGKAAGFYSERLEVSGRDGAPLIALPTRIELVAPDVDGTP